MCSNECGPAPVQEFHDTNLARDHNVATIRGENRTGDGSLE